MFCFGTYYILIKSLSTRLTYVHKFAITLLGLKTSVNTELP